jgi:hypothetical protein
VTPTARVTRMRWHSGVLAWALWALAMLGVATIPWFDHLLRQARRPELIQLDATAVPMVLAALVAATVGRCWPAAGHSTRSAGCSWRWGWR